MRKTKLKKKKVAWLCILVLLLIGIFFSINKKDFLSGILKDLLYFPTIFIKTPSTYDVVGENINQEILKEKEDLEKLLDISSTLTDFDKINAVVVERNNSYWFEYLTINKGYKDGIRKGMIVVTGDGLIGTIKEVNILTSTVKLITSNDDYNNISVSIVSDSFTINKILSTDTANNKIISGIDNTYDIKEGDKVYTSGLSDIYPAGIIIGKIKKIENDNYGISQKAYVELASNPNSIRFVSVLSRKIDNE